MRIATEIPKTADCVIVGGGILGATTAFFAAGAGLKCVALEKRPALCTLTTPVSTGAFRAQFDNPEEIAVVKESIEFFRNFREHLNPTLSRKERRDQGGAPHNEYDIHLQQQGYLWLTTSEDGAARQKRIVEAQHGWGLRDVEWMTGDEARKRFPYLDRKIISARFRQDDGWLETKPLTMGMAAASGAQFCVQAPVTGFEIKRGRVKAVKTAQGAISCETAVIAAGPFSAEVAKLAGVKLDFDLRIRQKLIFPELPEVPRDAPMTIDEDTGAHWRPVANSSRAAFLRSTPGAQRARFGAGAYLLYTQHDSPTGPPLEDVPPSANFYFGLLNPASATSVARITPFWKEVWQRNTDLWFLMAGQYSYTPDHRPYLGPAPGVEGLFLNCGYSGHGIMGSVGGSRRVVDTMTGKLKASENPFRADRKMSERTLDVL